MQRYSAFCLALVCILLLPAAGTAAQTGDADRAAFEKRFPSRYRVKRNETLASIARRREIFNDYFMWPLIYKANRDQIRDPDIIFPGQELVIPRDMTLEEIIEARKKAHAPAPDIVPRDAYSPELYRRYFQKEGAVQKFDPDNPNTTGK